MPTKTIVFLADLGHATPKVPMLAHEIGKFEQVNVLVVCPKINAFQRKQFLPLQKFNFEILEIPNVTSNYKRFNGYPSLFARALRFHFRLQDNFLNRIRNSDNQISKSFKSIDYWVKGVESILKSRSLLNSDSVLISSCSPIVTHAAASKIAERNQLIWIADYRDGWSTNHVSPIEDLSLALKIESDFLKNAKGVTVSSNQLIPDLQRIFDGPIQIIHNGYITLNEDIHSTCYEIPLNILYLGQVYERFQDFYLFLDSLEVVNRDQVKVKVKFVGDSSISIKKYYSDRNVNVPDYIQTSPSVAISEVGSFFSKADILLFFTWKEELNYSKEFPSTVIGSKIYDYLGARRLVLAFGPNSDGAIDDLLTKTGTGFRVDDSATMQKAINRIVEGDLNLSCINLEELSRYSFQHQAFKLITFLNSLQI